MRNPIRLLVAAICLVCVTTQLNAEQKRQKVESEITYRKDTKKGFIYFTFTDNNGKEINLKRGLHTVNPKLAKTIEQNIKQGKATTYKIDYLTNSNGLRSVRINKMKLTVTKK